MSAGLATRASEPLPNARYGPSWTFAARRFRCHPTRWGRPANSRSGSGHDAGLSSRRRDDPAAVLARHPPHGEETGMNHIPTPVFRRRDLLAAAAGGLAVAPAPVASEALAQGAPTAVID